MKSAVKRTIRPPKHGPISPAAVRFAQAIVERARVSDPDIAETLVQAIASVPRQKFMPEALMIRAFEDNAYPIGYGQTISKPSTVARMLALARISPGMRVLEIGCGSGYASAVISACGAEVYAVEYIGLLAQATRKKLDSLNYHRILVRSGDGRKGWAEHAPYDAVIISAAFERIEPELLSQVICPGGRVVAPMGTGRDQTMTVWESTADGFVQLELERCAFVTGQ